MTSPLQLIQGAVPDPDPGRPVVELHVERRQLARRIWRGVAEDGCEFGFHLERPLQHGQTFFESAGARYVIAQREEDLLAVDLNTLPPSAAAGIGWAVGNLHLEFSADGQRALTPDEPAARQLFSRIDIPCVPLRAVFRPGRFARGTTRAETHHELGTSHRH